MYVPVRRTGQYRYLPPSRAVAVNYDLYIMSQDVSSEFTDTGSIGT